jgi:hypothetical protein
MLQLRYHVIHILTAHLMAAYEGVPTCYIRAAAIRRGDGAQVSLDWTAWGHEDGLRWDIQRVGVCFQTVDDAACPKATLSRWWKARILLFKQAWEQWGLGVCACFTPSRRAYMIEAFECAPIRCASVDSTVICLRAVVVNDRR